MWVLAPRAVLDAPVGAFLRRRHLTIADARSDVFDYIERCHNPEIPCRLDALDRGSGPSSTVCEEGAEPEIQMACGQ